MDRTIPIRSDGSQGLPEHLDLWACGECVCTNARLLISVVLLEAAATGAIVLITRVWLSAQPNQIHNILHLKLLPIET